MIDAHYSKRELITSNFKIGINNHMEEKMSDEHFNHSFCRCSTIVYAAAAAAALAILIRRMFSSTTVMLRRTLLALST